MLPPKSDPRWRDLVRGKLKTAPSLLATKFFMARIAGLAKNDSSEENISKLVNESVSFFTKNSVLAKADIEMIFGKEKKK
ncbi:MAG TPA: hypothetical protein VMV81_07850 [Phycisphaerae bacterium]|nr:hypothetical protein [Phycisphaerae bacterium]